MPKQFHIAIFASGTGSNAAEIIRYFKRHPTISVDLVCSNKPTAGVLDIARREGVEVLNFDRAGFYETNTVIRELQSRDITHIVLAGFLWLIPNTLIQAFEDRIINIHPALLPKFGGKGMYGDHVHKAVKAAGEMQTGITIHLVNAHYDEGKILLQKAVGLRGVETPEEIAGKVQELEHQWFAPTIEKWINKC
jgi:phosphoribosylglycinamide formyltransferase 1